MKAKVFIDRCSSDVDAAGAFNRCRIREGQSIRSARQGALAFHRARHAKRKRRQSCARFAGVDSGNFRVGSGVERRTAAYFFRSAGCLLAQIPILSGVITIGRHGEKIWAFPGKQLQPLLDRLPAEAAKKKRRRTKLSGFISPQWKPFCFLRFLVFAMPAQ